MKPKKRGVMDAIRVISFPFRYGIILELSKLLTPTLFKNILYPKIYAELRPMIQYIQENSRSLLTGAEIGVFKGHHAHSILKNLQVKTLYLVDPYQIYLQDGEVINPIPAKRIAKQTLKSFNQVQWVTASEIPENLDFIYIDANHQYKAVKADLQLYYGKVKVGGVLGGHDFSNQFSGVVQAVTEFAVSHRLKLYVEQPDWWIVKP